MKSRVIVYVDGFNLYYGMKAEYSRRYLWLDLAGLATAMLKPHQELAVVRYFTARPRNDPQGGARQADYTDALTARGVDVHFGRYQKKTLRCGRCHKGYRSYEEKETDVAIAANVVRDAARGSMDTAMLISGDSDLLPALRAAKDMNPTMAIVVAFPPKRTSNELKDFATASFVISRGKFRDSQLPDTLELPDGRTVARPPRWC